MGKCLQYVANDMHYAYLSESHKDQCPIMLIVDRSFWPLFFLDLLIAREGYHQVIAHFPCGIKMSNVTGMDYIKAAIDEDSTRAHRTYSGTQDS